MNQEDKFKNSIPVGELGIVALESVRNVKENIYHHSTTTAMLKKTI